MLKISKDKLKVKRRIPFRQEPGVENPEEVEGAMVYVERYPEELSHEQLATIFKRAGRIKHVSMPKYKGSKQPKGFAFVLFSSTAEAEAAVQTFNNTVPSELVDAMSGNFIAVQGAVRAFRVMHKADWLRTKAELRDIKKEIALLNPGTIFQSR